jgi:hypothetical protein
MNGKRDTRTPVTAGKLTGPALQRAYQNALHVLDRDAAILDQLRSRANILLAALAIGVTALGAILASAKLQPHLSVWFVVLAVVFLGSAIFCCIGVLWPTRDHGDFTAPELERARDEAAVAALIKAAAADRDAAVAAARETVEQARADVEALTRAAELGLDTPERDDLLAAQRQEFAAARQEFAAARVSAGNEEASEVIPPGVPVPSREDQIRARIVRAETLAAARESVIRHDKAARDNAIRRAQDRVVRAQANADTEAESAIVAAQEAETRAAAAAREALRRADAEVRIRAAEAAAWARVAAADAENRDDAIIQGREVIEQARAAEATFILDADGDTEAQVRAMAEARIRAAEAAAWARVAAAKDAKNLDEAIIQGRKAIKQARASAEALVRVAAEARDHAVARVAVLERRRPLWERAGRARKHLTQPWKAWGHALGRDQRLWKTVLNQQDLAQVPPGGSQDEVDRVLLESLYLAHERNLGTLSRRADLLRIASLLVFAFVIAFGIWLSTTTPSTSTGGHPSSTAPAAGRPSDLIAATSPPTMPPPSTEPGRS